MQLLSSALWFVAVVAMIPLALWLVKRSPIGARLASAAPGGDMRSVAVLALSASQRVVTIEVGTGSDRTWLVLGVTPQSITTLHRLPPQGDVPVATAGGVPSFAEVIGRLKRGGGNHP